MGRAGRRVFMSMPRPVMERCGMLLLGRWGWGGVRRSGFVGCLKRRRGRLIGMLRGGCGGGVVIRMRGRYFWGVRWYGRLCGCGGGGGVHSFDFWTGRPVSFLLARSRDT